MPNHRLFLGRKIVFLLVILAQLTACTALDIHVEMPVLAPETGTATVEITTTAGSTITAETRARATITALAAENAHLAAQLTRDATSATPTTPSATPTYTPPATEAPTSTPKPSPRPSKTPKPTPRPTSTPVEPKILSFTASPDPLERGGTVTLTWNAQGVSGASITRLSPEGDIFLETEALDLPSSGSITLPVPDWYTERVKYYLGARDANGALYQAYVTVGIICRYEDYLAPRCPLTQDDVWAAYEPFERGYMVWRSDTRKIYVLYADGRYETYDDTWNDGEPVDVPGTPPQGLHVPVRGFGTLYAQEPRIRNGLGWATAPEAGYTMRIETIPGGSGRYPGTSVYFTLPDNRVVNLYPFSSTWEIVA